MKLLEEEEDYENDNDDQQPKRDPKGKGKGKDKAKEVVVEDPPQEDAKPLGDPVRVSGKGRGRRKHYQSFEFDGNQYTLVCFLLFVPIPRKYIDYDLNVSSIDSATRCFCRRTLCFLCPRIKTKSPMSQLLR